jgi:hypothetical protein
VGEFLKFANGEPITSYSKATPSGSFRGPASGAVRRRFKARMMPLRANKRSRLDELHR